MYNYKPTAQYTCAQSKAIGKQVISGKSYIPLYVVRI